MGAAVKITVLATILSGLIQAVVVVILARLIGPADYGAYALSVAVLSLTTSFVISAAERSLIVADEVDFRGLMAAMGTLVLVTACLTAAVVAVLAKLGWLIERLDILTGLLLGSFFSGLATPPRVFLRRRIAYNWIVLSELSGLVVGTGLTGITLALLGFGAYSLVGGAIVQNLITLCMLLVGGAGGVSAAVSASALKALARGVMRVAKVSGLEVLHGQIPNFFVGYLGPSALGLFNRSQTIVQLPVQLLTTSITRVMISGIRASTGDRERLMRSSRLTVIATSAIIGPVSFGIAGSYVEFTKVMLGDKWNGAMPLVPLLALTSWAVMSAAVLGVISEAARHFGGKAIVQGLSSVVLIACLGISLTLGLAAAVAAIALGALFLVASNLVLTSRVLGLSPGVLIGWLMPGVTAGAACGIFSLFVAKLLAGTPPILTLCSQVAGCGALTAAYFMIWRRDIVTVIFKMILTPAWSRRIDLWSASKDPLDRPMSNGDDR